MKKKTIMRKETIKFIDFVKGTKVQLNKEWARANGGVPPKSHPVGRKGVVIGCATSPRCLKVRFEGSMNSQTFHIIYLDVIL